LANAFDNHSRTIRKECLKADENNKNYIKFLIDYRFNKELRLSLCQGVQRDASGKCASELP
jgi:hypothetical protein